MYAHNTLKRRWLGDVKIVFFGPSERLVVQDKEVANEVKDLAIVGESFACKTISDREGVSGELEKLGLRIEYVGSIISNLIKDGYTPMVW